jgi:hypothetical protein
LSCSLDFAFLVPFDLLLKNPDIVTIHVIGNNPTGLN